MLKNYVIIALRNIKKHKTYSFINIFGLAIGIAACSLILLWVQDELSYDDYHKNIGNIGKAILDVEGEYWNSSNWALAPILKQDYPEIEKASRYAARTRLLKYQQNRFYEQGAFVDQDFLEIFTYPLIAGNPKSALASDQSIILTRELATKYFATENPLGKVITMDNKTDLTVTGIIENVPSNSTFQFSFLAPVQLFSERKLNSWAVESQSYYLLRAETKWEDLNKKISGVVMKHDKRTEQNIDLFLLPYERLHLYSLSGTGPIVYVYLFTTIAFLILLIACINFMNLASARATQRAREIGIRKVVGAAKLNIIRQFFSESIILSFVALIVAIVLVYLFLPAFNALSGKQLSLNLVGSVSHTGGLVFITLITGLISGSYPSLVLSSFNPIHVLKTANSGGSSKSLLRRILVVSQFCAAIVLIISTMVIYKQLDFIRSKNLGFNREHVLVFPLYNSIWQNFESFMSQLNRDPNIIHVTTANNIPTRIGNINPVYWEGQTKEDYRTINFVAVDYDYFDTFEMTFAAGRKFSKEFSTDHQNYIVNEALAELMGFESVIGKMFSIWENEGQIIGVVKNFHSRSLHDEIVPIVFTCSPDWYWSLSRVFVKMKSDNISETLASIENTATKFAPDYPFTYSFLDEHFERLYIGDQQIGTIFKYFSVIAIFISCMGLFGLAAFMVGQRTKEIGIRRVLGASKSYILMILSREFIILIAVSNIIAWPLAYLVIKELMASYAYRTEISIFLYFAVGFITLLLTFFTITVQTVKATRANPVDALRYE
jgi:putative ABC transport system permease protein